ncbi:MAG: diphthamide biosynthesis enzyme Dph2 [Candidatus Micrarchaeota archaeon]|nr:diphthamide biosynthesis enzyme Dph2 [Candidatus Micrarchaeota archaeon]
MKILLQFPEGLKKFAVIEADKLENEGHNVFISASACYGACDLPLEEARLLDVDKIIHFGHNKFVKKKLNEKFEVEYVPWRIDISLDKLERYKAEFENKSLILITTVQHSHQINYMKEFLKKMNSNVFSDTGFYATEEAQILGCDALNVQKILAKNQNIDIILFIGSGAFHPKALAYLDNFDLLQKLRILSFDPVEGSLKDITEEIKRLHKKRLMAIARFVHANNIGIVISTKIGQFFPQQAENARKKLHKLGKKCYFLICNELNDMVIKNFYGIDALLNTACPRIMDDQEKFQIPIINYKDLYLVEEMQNRMNKKAYQ